jgi:hypothetical protein
MFANLHSIHERVNTLVCSFTSTTLPASRPIVWFGSRTLQLPRSSTYPNHQSSFQSINLNHINLCLSSIQTTTTMPSATQIPLSQNDTSVLSTLFDPESSPSSNTTSIPINPSLSPLPTLPTSSLPSLQSRELNAILPLNTPSPSPEALSTAITSLTELIEAEPKYASAWNNRAQALRILHGDLGEKTGDVLSDLSKAIDLASPPPAKQMEGVSPLQAKVLKGAHTQFGYVVYKVSKWRKERESTKEQSEATAIRLPESLQDMSGDELEELASRHFAMGGRYGNEIAREMAVRTNPYAKLCGSIVKSALMEEVRGGMGARPRIEVDNAMN